MDFKRIEFDNVIDCVDRYPTIVPGELKDLEGYRLSDVPSLLAARHADSDAHLSKAELVRLIEWKL